MRYCLLCLVFFAGCALGARHTIAGISPKPPDDLFTAASRELVIRGYTIENADRDGGFIVAEQERGRRGFGRYIDIIRVSIVPHDPGSSFNVSASTEMIPLTGNRRPDRLTAAVVDDAEEIRRLLADRP